MNLKTTYEGGTDPFEGDLRLDLHSLPEGARAIRATVYLEPSNPGTAPFREVFAFGTPAAGDLPAGAWGVERVPESGAGRSVEVSFHARRTLSGVSGSGSDATLQVDMGGAFVGIADDGTILSPEKPEKKVSLSGAVTPLPGLTVSGFMLTAPASGGIVTIDRVQIRSVPTNVSLRLQGMPPFWTHVGEMAAPLKSSDFAAVLDAFLAGAPAADGFYVVPLIVHSDAISRIDVTVSIEYVISRPVMPPYIPEAVLPYGYSSLPGSNEGLMTVAVPREARPVAGTGGRLSGSFEEGRVLYGTIGDQETLGAVVISPGRTVAQAVEMADEIPATGIDLPLANTEPGLSGLNLAIQEDADGKPSGKAIQSAGIGVERPVPGQSSWGSARLPAEFRFLKGRRYWLVIQSVSGDALWDVSEAADGATPLQASEDGGFSWRARSVGDKPIQGIFRLRHPPERFSVPVQLQIGRGEDALRVGFNRFSPLGRVSFDVEFSSELSQYLDGAAGEAPCGKGDLLANGDFEDPPWDDATSRIFGFDEGGSTGDAETPASLAGIIDLSRPLDMRVQRLIALSIDGGDVVRIDCAGGDAARTTPEEIVSAVNRAVAGKAKASLIVMDTGLNKKVLRMESLKTGADSSVRLHCWCGNRPEGWQGGAGVIRVKGRSGVAAAIASPLSLIAEFNPGFHTSCDGSGGGFAGIGSFRISAKSRISSSSSSGISGEPAVLSQSFKASGGCAYILRFVLAAIDLSRDLVESAVGRLQCLMLSTLGFEGTAMPSWEVVWKDADGKTVESTPGTISPPEDAVPVGVMSYLYEGRLRAPTGAVRGEILFVQPEPGVLVIEEASIHPTSSAISNGSFIQWGRDGEPVPIAWKYQGRIERTTSGGTSLPGVVLRGGGDESSLVQRAEVIPGETYSLKVISRPSTFAEDGEARPVEERPRLDMQWTAAGEASGDPVTLALDERGFPERLWTGRAPAGVDGALVSIIVPAGSGSVDVQSVALQREEMISVPLTFLSEAPGELKVSGLTVTYDLPSPVEPEMPFRAAVSSEQRAGSAAVPRRSRLADRPALLLFGVSKRFAASLSRASVETVGDIAEVEISTMTNAGVPENRAIDIKAASEIALKNASVSDSFREISGMPLQKILAAGEEDLAGRTGMPRSEAARLQKAMRALRLAIKDTAFNELILSDLLSG